MRQGLGPADSKTVPNGNVARMLLSHHVPEHMGRTIRIPLGRRREVCLCARCTGLFGGLAAGLLVLVLFGSSLPPISQWARVGLSILAMAPAVADFHLQLLHGRESNNPRRVFSGALFGLASGWAVWNLIRGNIWPLAALVASLFLYWSWFFSGKERAGEALRHLSRYAAHYEECRRLDFRNRTAAPRGRNARLLS